jgi:muconolactone delta-isomerase
MRPEDVKRLKELELLELDELDADELRELRSERRAERAKARLLQRFRKAKRVWRMPDLDGADLTVDGYLYALSYDDLRSLLNAPDGDPLLDAIEEIDRPDADDWAVSVSAQVYWRVP